jgi:hypothetical protein
VTSNTTVQLGEISVVGNADWLSQHVPVEKGVLTLDFRKDAENLWFSDALVLREGVMWFHAEGSEPTEGGRYKINGTNIIKESKTLVATDNLRWRELPSTSAALLDYDFMGSRARYIQLPFLPKGIRLSSVGHTETVEIIDGIEAFWYYVDYWEDASRHFGWVFGGYVTEYQEKNAEKYASDYREEIGRHDITN